MGNWKDLLNELKQSGSPSDLLRRKYLNELHQTTSRNVVAYYSGWLQKPHPGPEPYITDQDMQGFMTAFHRLERARGLDLLLHTPGGDVAATEAIGKYIQSLFEDVRVIVPQLALSGGTMLALGADCIVMGRQSSLGPIDPQLRGLPAHGVVEEIERAYLECKDDPAKAIVWAPILQKYSPTFYGQCEKAIKWANEIAEEWLRGRMFKDESSPDIARVINELGNHAASLSHSRHYSAVKCLELGLKIEMLEDDQPLQDAVLSAHHAMMLTLQTSPAIKVIENHLGASYIVQVSPQ